MKWQMNENSLFAILLRSSWWVSFAIAAALTAVAVALLPEPYRFFGAVTGLPFFVIGCIAAWRQFQAPSTARIDSTLAAVRAMSWVEFSRAIEAAYRRDGYDVTAVNAAAADFEDPEGVAHRARQLQALEGGAHGRRAVAGTPRREGGA